MASLVDDDALYLLAANGRRHWEKESALKAWNEGEDFLRLEDGLYTDLHDVPAIVREGYKRLIFLNPAHEELTRIELAKESSNADR